MDGLRRGKGGREKRGGREGGEKKGEGGRREGRREGRGREKWRGGGKRRKEERRKERGSGRGKEGKKEGSWRVWVRCSVYLCTHLEGQRVEPFRKLLQFAAAHCLTVAIVRKHDISLNVQTCVCTHK